MSPFVARAQASALPTSDLTTMIHRPWRVCTNVSCSDPATAQVLVGADWKDKCFTHEREYMDRFGDPTAIRPLS